MVSVLLATFVSFSCVARTMGTRLFDRNLAYSSPFANAPHLSHDTRSLQARHVQFVKRQHQLDDTVSSNGFTDEHYPTFYGGDFSSSPWIYNGGVNFTHSVASGDPLQDSILLWTRAVPAGAPPDQSIPVCVTFKIFDNEGLSGRPLDAGDAFTTYDVDWTLKVEANNLQPDSHYWFQFSDCTDPDIVSPVGTTRTIASPDTPAEEVNGGKPLTLAVFSCSRYQDGWFNAYGVAAHNTSADFFVHLGDYIYESLGDGAPIGRAVAGKELATIADYRQRLNQYRTDPGLVYAHQKAPWITVWDDHEVADQAWKAGTADTNDTSVGCSFSPSGACFTDRKLAAVRAYHEWMPIRQVDPDDKLRIWRNFQIGKLLDLTMLDTRQYDRDITDLYYNTVIKSIADEMNRSLMGSEQEAWFYETLSNSKARGAVWRVVGQQIVFTMLNEDDGLDVDAWDGYRANRNRVLDHLYSNEISNTIILSGDSHANWVSDLAHPNQTVTYDPITGNGAIGVEFAGTAVSSTSTFGPGISPADANKLSARYVAANIDLQWSEGSYRGFFTLALDAHQANATYWAMRNVNTTNLDAFASASFIVKSGTNRLSRPIAGGEVLAGVLKFPGQ
ncbi:PhoD-like phosphatase-domain-containing protein [Dichomitus squalens]|uniref:PhoD-like phosphatase-domain-containing protein n=1 Tax=Dichomitus squalens TaxID=114155 RepID=A0A4Q9N6R7_9APHY|nr:PhoD-like phosphatase-domain-containing protein [Dichomitus squalens]